MKIAAISVMSASLLFLSAAAAVAQGTTAANPGGAAANVTTAGALGKSSVPAQSLKPTTGGQGLGYAPSAPSVGVSPDVTGSTTVRPNETIAPAPGATGSTSSVGGSSAPLSGG